jgi:hypothetical protein
MADQKPPQSDAVAELHAQARADYGTPDERADRAEEVRIQSGHARAHGNEAAGTPRGCR